MAVRWPSQTLNTVPVEIVASMTLRGGLKPTCGKVLAEGYARLLCGETEKLCGLCGHCQPTEGNWDVLTGTPPEGSHCQCTLSEMLADMASLMSPTVP